MVTPTVVGEIVSFSNLTAKPTSAMLPVGPHTSDRSKGYEPDTQRDNRTRIQILAMPEAVIPVPA